MKIDIDKEADALYLRLDDSKITESQEVAPGIILDYNAADQVVGIEMLNLSRRTPYLDRAFSFSQLRGFPLTLSLSKGRPLVVRQAHHERGFLKFPRMKRPCLSSVQVTTT